MTFASVIIPSRGGARRLPIVLTALARQRHSHVEVVLVIDGDIDGSAIVASGWADQLNLTTLVLPENRGRSVALNTGFGAARGDVLIRCDDDLEPDADWVGHHVHMHEQRECGVIGLYRNQYLDSPYARAYAVPRDERFRRDAYAAPPDGTWRFWAGNVSTTSEIWHRVGPYDTAYRAYGFEDVDWGYRLHQLSIPIVLNPSLEVTHHSPATSARIRAVRAFHSGAARRIFEQRHGTAALGTSDLEPTNAWGRATRAAGRRLDRRGVDRLGRGADALAHALPRYAAEKAIAFAVESAAHAGHAQPDNLDLSV